MFDVITIGSATRDNFLRGKYELIDWPKAQSRKAIALPFGDKLGVDEVYMTIGGNAANASVTFARYGYNTAIAAKIGKDLPAQELIMRLKKERVNTKLIAQTDAKPTAYSVLLLDQTGERTILGYHGASDTFTMNDVRLTQLRSGWWYLSLAGESDAMFLPLLQFARENGIKVAFNPSGHHLNHKREEIFGALKDLAFLVLNGEEAAELVGIPFEKEKEVFKKLDELTPGIVAVTDGPNGVTVSDGQNIYKAGIFKEQAVVDRTGAGDSFGSGFTAVLASCAMRDTRYAPEAIKEAIRFASANATSVVEHIGATDGILIKKEFETSDRWKNFEIIVQNL